MTSLDKHRLARAYKVVRDGHTYVLDKHGWRDEADSPISGRDAEWLFSLLYVTLNAEDVSAINPAELLERARDARLLAHFKRAERLCQRFLNQEPEHDGGLAIYSSVLRSLKRPTEAVAATEARAGSGYGPLLTSRAAALCDLKRWAEAQATISMIPSESHDDESQAVLARIERMSPPPPELFEAQVQFQLRMNGSHSKEV